MGDHTQARGASTVIGDLDELLENLGGVRARAAAAFADEMFFFARVVEMVQRRERERADRAEHGAKVSASQLAMRELHAEIAAALNLSERQVAARVDQAHTFVTEFPETMLEAGEGRLSSQHAVAIADVGAGIPDVAGRAEFERLAIDIARELTPAQLRIALGGLVDRLDPEGTQDRIREARAERGVRKRSLAHGMSQLVLTAPTAEVEGAVNRLGDIAAEIHTDNRTEAAERAGAQAATVTQGTTAKHSLDREPGVDGDHGNGNGTAADERTRQQIMADVALDLLLTGAPEGHGATDERRAELGAIRATVHISIPAATLAGTATGGAGVIGAGQIDDGTARALAGASETWYRYFIDPTTGVPISVDKRRPCKAQKRLLRARDGHCRFPGCRHPARKSDIDHTVAVADGGPTALWNLAHLCERHHTVKHHTDWRVEQLPGGVLRFTAPTGRRHTTRPPGAVRFTSDRPPGTPKPEAVPF